MAPRPDDRMPASAEEKPVAVYAALAANLGIAIAKFMVAGIAKSSALLAEAIHSLVDTANELLLLVGVHRSRHRPDTDHPYGYGKELYVWSLVVAVMLFGIGGGLSIFEGIEQLRHPSDPGKPLWGYVVVAVAAVFESSSFFIARRKLRTKGRLFTAVQASKDPSRFLVVLEDFAALVGLAIVALGLYLRQLTGKTWPDAVASLLVGLVLAATAAFLVNETRGLLVGESVSKELRDDIQRLAHSDPAVAQVKPPLTMQLGPREVLVNLSLGFRAELNAEEVAKAIDRLQDRIRAEHEDVRFVFIEADSLRRRPGESRV